MTSRSPLVAPGPPPRRLARLGPMVLAIAGVAAMVTLARYRDGLRLTYASAADRPVWQMSLATPPVPETRVAPSPRAADAFAAPLAVPAREAAVAAPPALVPVFVLQSIVVGRRGRACMINNTTCRVGDSILNAHVEAIERDAVTLRFDGRAIELRLAKPGR